MEDKERKKSIMLGEPTDKVFDKTHKVSDVEVRV